MGHDANTPKTVEKPTSRLHLKANSCVAAMLLIVSLISACSYNIYEAAHWGNNEKVIAYLNNGADINAPNRWGCTPLAVAMFRRHYDTAKMLIEKGADINVIDKPHDVPLIMYPVIDGNLDMVRYLIDHGADVNLANSKGFTALIEAAYHGHTEIGRLLLEHGADVNAATVGRVTALSNARGRGHKEFEKMLAPYIAAAQKTETAAASDLKKEPLDDDELAYKNAQKDGSISAYEKYLNDFLSGKFKSEAQAELDSLYFREATRLRTIEANQKYLERFPNGKHAMVAKQRLVYLPLMNACLKLEFEEIDQLLASGKSLAGHVEPAVLLMRLLQKQTMKTMRISEFQVQEMQGPSKEDQLFDLGVFKKLLGAGADPHLLRIKGFEKAGRKSLDGVAYLYSTGNPGEIVPASEGGMSALEFAEANNLVNFKKLLLGKGQISAPAQYKKNLAAKGNVAEPKKVEPDPAQKNPDKIVKVEPKKSMMLVTLDTTYFKEKNDQKCRNYKPDYSKYHTIVHLAANISIGKVERNGKEFKAYIASTEGKDPASGEGRRIGFSVDTNSLFLSAGTRDNPVKMSMRVGEPGTRITFEGDKNDPFEPIPGLRIWDGAIDIDPECGLLIHAKGAR